jgi:hypothetical protein
MRILKELLFFFFNFYLIFILFLYLPYSFFCFAITENKMERLKSVQILQEACLKQ